MNVQLIIDEQDPHSSTRINLPPSVEVNKLLHNIAAFWAERINLVLEKAENAARDGDIEALRAETNSAVKLVDIQEACERAAARYDVLLNANPREMSSS